eukprot:scaffold228486_cov19-Tisochrysis_lutea.AAC.1
MRMSQVRLGEQEALDDTLQWFENRMQTELKKLVYYQERRLRNLGLVDDGECAFGIGWTLLEQLVHARPVWSGKRVLFGLTDGGLAPLRKMPSLLIFISVLLESEQPLGLSSSA